MSRYVRWSQAEHGEPVRFAAMAAVAPIFLAALPAVVGLAGRRLDHAGGVAPLPGGAVTCGLGVALTSAGFGLGIWSVATQLGRGKGTPLPVMPTQELLTQGPYGVCRNPMTLGAISAYLGIALLARTAAGTAISLSMAAILLAYLRLLEERELAERFGEAYLAYRRSTPFILPRLTGIARRTGPDAGNRES